LNDSVCFFTVLSSLFVCFLFLCVKSFGSYEFRVSISAIDSQFENETLVECFVCVTNMCVSAYVLFVILSLVVSTTTYFAWKASSPKLPVMSRVEREIQTCSMWFLFCFSLIQALSLSDEESDIFNTILSINHNSFQLCISMWFMCDVTSSFTNKSKS